MGLDGELSFHSVLYGLNFDVTKSKSTFFSVCLNCFSALTKLVPLSEKMMLMFPCHEMNLLSDMLNESVDKSLAISNCMTQVVKHVRLSSMSFFKYFSFFFFFFKGSSFFHF